MKSRGGQETGFEGMLPGFARQSDHGVVDLLMGELDIPHWNNPVCLVVGSLDNPHLTEVFAWGVGRSMVDWVVEMLLGALV